MPDGGRSALTKVHVKRRSQVAALSRSVFAVLCGSNIVTISHYCVNTMCGVLLASCMLVDCHARWMLLVSSRGRAICTYRLWWSVHIALTNATHFVTATTSLEGTCSDSVLELCYHHVRSKVFILAWSTLVKCSLLISQRSNTKPLQTYRNRQC